VDSSDPYKQKDGQHFLNVQTLAMPNRQSIHCEAVPEGMKAHCAFASNGLDAKLPDQEPKRFVRAVIGQRCPFSGTEKHFGR
jgi:hypothetical protein